MARSPSFMVVSPSFGFVAQGPDRACRAQPAGIVYGSAGVGSTAHMHAAQSRTAGFRRSRAFRGTPEAVNDAMTGRFSHSRRTQRDSFRQGRQAADSGYDFARGRAFHAGRAEHRTGRPARLRRR